MKKLYFLLFLISIQANAQISKGDRTLAWQIDMAQNGNYDSAFSYGVNGCMESIHIFSTWAYLQPDTNNFDQTAISSFLDVINIYHPANSMKVELQIAPINTTRKETPLGLMGVNFSDPLMIKYFKQFLDTLFVHIPNVDLTALNIGNESDAFWGINASEYLAYKVFLDSISPYAKQLYFNLHGKDLKIGTTLTHHGLTDASTKNLCKNLNMGRDIIATTYYPLNNNFTMKNPNVVQADFDSLVSVYNDTNQPIYFVECGYSSSSVCNSSEALQAQFYKNVFNAWDSHINNIKYITIFKNTDWSQSDVSTFKTYYGINDTIFGEYLRTLGVRTYPGNGSDKLAYNQILCELNQRNWCSVSCNLTKIEELSISKIVIYPNPSNSYINIDLPPNEKLVNTKLMSPNGQIITIQINNNKIDISNLTKGFYVIELETSSQLIYRKILKN